MDVARASVEDVWGWLGQVPDPEIPVISVVDLGIVRDVRWDDRRHPARLVVTVTPTYSGCPATEVIASSIRETLEQHGVAGPVLETRLSPAWTTDWLAPAAHDKLRRYGIAPPLVMDPSSRRKPGSSFLSNVCGLDPGFRRGDEAEPRRAPAVACPRCGADDTELLSQFGSTPCKALHRCKRCLEPFDHFKCH